MKNKKFLPYIICIGISIILAIVLTSVVYPKLYTQPTQKQYNKLMQHSDLIAEYSLTGKVTNDSFTQEEKENIINENYSKFPDLKISTEYSINNKKECVLYVTMNSEKNKFSILSEYPVKVENNEINAIGLDFALRTNQKNHYFYIFGIFFFILLAIVGYLYSLLKNYIKKEKNNTLN